MCFWMRWMGVSKYICLFRHPRFVVVRLAIGEGPLLLRALLRVYVWLGLNVMYISDRYSPYGQI